MDIDDFFDSLGINQEPESPLPQELMREAEENANAIIQLPEPPSSPAPTNQDTLEEVRTEATSTNINMTDEDVDNIINGYMPSEPEPEPEPEQEASEQEEVPQVARPEDVFGTIPNTSEGDAINMGHSVPVEEIPEPIIPVIFDPVSMGRMPVNPEILNAIDDALPPTENEMFNPGHFVAGVDVAGPEQQEQTPEVEAETSGDPEPTAPQEALILSNSPTILMDDTTTRFSGAEWYEEIKRQRVILAGLGGIGSWTALQLARMGLEALCMYDDDKVEVVNMAGQFYSLQDPGKFKVTAIADTLHRYTTMGNIYAVHEKFTTETQAGDVMICGFDNMEARKLFYTKWKSHVLYETDDEERCLFIDGRLSMDTLQVFCIRGDDEGNMEKYETNYLFNDEEADHTVCSMKQTTYLACMIGSFIVNLFTNFVAGLLDPIIPYDLPFKTEYESQSMMFKTEH